MKNNNDVKDLAKSFIEILNHDLKTPIIAQIRALELMLNGEFGDLNQTQKEIAELTLDSCQYMYSMVSTLISTFRLDCQEFTLNYSTFNIMNLVESTLKKLEKYSKERNIEIVIIPQIETPEISADEIRMSKVIFTLLINSIYTSYPNSTLKIYIHSNQKRLLFRLEQHGKYIPPEKMKSLFTLQTEASQKFNRVGEGIGLYLVKKIIEKHNGRIIAESYSDQKNILGFEMPVSETIYSDSYV